ncbi:MAG: hypothetical protein KF878_29375 [Planctomycetes bacterium]|nr:hypothetical protein [Planctomycetota bacterium]
MRTTLNSIRLLCLVVGLGMVALAPPAYAQPRAESPEDYRARKAAEKAIRDEVRNLLAEYARLEAGASGFEGMWRLSGTRTVARSGAAGQDTGFTGDIVVRPQPDGTFAIDGKAYLEGRNTGLFTAQGKVVDGVLTGTYKATIAGEGELTLRRAPGGLLLGMRGIIAGNEVTCDGEGVPQLTLDRQGLEARLFELEHKLQSSRYPRPEPVRYRTPSRKTEVRFTPTVEWDPHGVEQQVIDLIDGAQRSIDMAVFEFSLMRVAHALVRAKERGVAVRMVYDNREDHQPAILHLKAHDLPLRDDGRSGYMHNKFILVDERIVWTGSTNLAPGGIYVADNNAISFTSPELAAEFKKEFEEMFVDNQFGPRSPRNTTLDWITVDRGVKVQVRFAPEDSAMARVMEAVKGAQRSIRFIAFAYTSKPLCDAMIERIQAGVKVEGIFESRHAGWADTKIGPLHAAGAKVRFDSNPNALHHKVIIVDDRYVLTGSFNFSEGADRSNDENLLVVDNRQIAQAFVREFNALMSITDPSDPRIATSGMGGGGPSGEGMIDRLDDSFTETE